MLEALFARRGQCEAFLRLCLCGVALGAALQLSRTLHRRSRLAGSVWDVVWCAAGALAFGAVTLRSGGGARAYGLLGLMLGAALWGAGVAPLLSAAAKLCRKSSPAQAGKAQARDEFNTDEERRAEEEKAP